MKSIVLPQPHKEVLKVRRINTLIFGRASGERIKSSVQKAGIVG